MRVLQLQLHNGIGGMETMLRRLDAGLTARGVCVRTHALDGDAIHAGVKSGRVRRIRDLSRVVKSFRPDVIISHSALPAVYARMCFPRLKHVVVVHSLAKDVTSGRLGAVEKYLSTFSDATVFVSRQAMDLYAETFPGKGGSRQWIPNGVDVRCPPKGSGTSGHKLIAVSRLTPSKDIETAIRAVPLLIRTYGDVELAIVGDAASREYEAMLRGMVDQDDELRKRVRFLGRRTDVHELMVDSDVLVHASRYESQGLVLAEAASLGLPAVLTESVRMAVWWPMSLGVFRSGDHEDLARVIGDIFGDPSRRDLAMKCVPAAKESLSEEGMIAAYLDLLKTVTST